MATPILGVLPRRFMSLTSTRLLSTTGLRCAKKFKKHNNRIGISRKVFKTGRPAAESLCGYQDLLSWRRAEASRSVLIQVASQHDANNIFRDLSLIGAVASMHHFVHVKDYILVEFKDQAHIPHFLSTVEHFSNSSKIPTQSRIIFYVGQYNNSHSNRGYNNVPVTSCTQDKFQPAHLFQASSISEQMELLHASRKLDECGSRLRFFLCSGVEDLLRGLLPECRVLPFGSAVNGFGWQGSDLDMMLEQQHGTKEMSMSQYKFMTKRGHDDERIYCQRSLSVIADMLFHFAPSCYNVQRILNARIPIVKFVHEAADIECDLSFQNVSAPKMSELMYILGELDGRARPLVSSVKQWAQAQGVTRSQPGVWPANFTLLSMVIFFLQTRSPPILPSVKQLHLLAESRDRFVMDGMDYSFITNIAKVPRTTNTQSLEELLLEFFHFFLDFDFGEQALSMVEGKAVVKADASPIYIENPLEVGHNIGRNVNAEELEKMKRAMQQSLRELEGSRLPRRTSSWGLMQLVQPSDVPTSSVQVSHLFSTPESVGTSKSSSQMNPVPSTSD